MKCIQPKTIWPHRSVEWCDANEEYSLSVPCGKCLACLSNRRNEWAFRLEQEYKYSSSAYFVTLTYDEKHLRTNKSLNKRDVQLYLKRLRKRDGTHKIRYYAVGEYGTKSARPHYHILLFNVANESAIREGWCDSRAMPIGFVHIGKVTQASVAYTLKYMVQPFQEVEGLEKPFSLMSRGYGIGGRYLTDQMVQWHRDNDANYVIRDGIKSRLSRFYKSKIWYDLTDRERVSKAAILQSLQSQEAERRELEKRYGSRGHAKYIEMRDAMLKRVKTKVAFTQKF